jgi:hypothetical protein
MVCLDCVLLMISCDVTEQDPIHHDGDYAKQNAQALVFSKGDPGKTSKNGSTRNHPAETWEKSRGFVWSGAGVQGFAPEHTPVLHMMNDQVSASDSIRLLNGFP